jgi:hypothetical protein
MRSEPAYNPLDKRNLGVSVADALLAKALGPLPPEEPFIGAGVYAIYYTGGFPAYGQISLKSSLNVRHRFTLARLFPLVLEKGALGWTLLREQFCTIAWLNTPIRSAKCKIWILLISSAATL